MLQCPLEEISWCSPLALHAVGRPASPNEPLPRDDLVALKKLQAEGRLSERQTVLGWDIDTRVFTTILPDLKCVDWKSQIETIISKQCTAKVEIDSLIGQLSHAAMTIPLD